MTERFLYLYKFVVDTVCELENYYTTHSSADAIQERREKVAAGTRSFAVLYGSFESQCSAYIDWHSRANVSVPLSAITWRIAVVAQYIEEGTEDIQSAFYEKWASVNYFGSRYKSYNLDAAHFEKVLARYNGDSSLAQLETDIAFRVPVSKELWLMWSIYTIHFDIFDSEKKINVDAAKETLDLFNSLSE